VAEHDNPPVGSVAEEAARLLDALGGWAGTATAGYAAGSAPRRAAPSAFERGPGGLDSDGPLSGEPGSDGPLSDEPDTDGPGRHHRCDSCGAENGVGRAVACQLCPVCQGIGILRSVRPETVDRLADLATAVAAALREVATHRRGPGETSSAGGRPTTRVQDIAVEEDDGTGPEPGSATS
jgi:hypothetical protein